jgi:putative ABC transport system substrate-binding protein
MPRARGGPTTSRLPRNPARLLTALALALLLQSAHASRAAAGQVVLVKASDAEPYAQAETAVRDALTRDAPAGKRHEVRSVSAKDVTEKGVAATIGQPDAVVAIGTPAARWLHQQLPANVRLVYCMVNNAAEAGLLQGRDCTGVVTEVALAEQFKLVAETLPRARVVGTLCRSDTAEGKAAVQSLRESLPAGWRVEAVAVNDFPSVAAAIDALIRKNVDVVWTSAEQKIYDTATVRALLLAALRNKTPVWGFSPAFVRAGALFGVGVEPRAQGAQAADLVAKLPAEPPEVPPGKEPGRAGAARERAQPPRDFQIAVNLIVARQLGLDVPDAVVRRAAFVYRPED